MAVMSKNLRADKNVLEQEHTYEFAEIFIYDNLVRLAYLSDIFGKLNTLNLQLQGKNKYFPQVTDKISSFTYSLKNLHEFVDTTNYDATSDSMYM